MEELDARRTDQVLAPLVEEPPDVLLSLVLLECGGIPVEFVEHARSGRSLDQVTLSLGVAVFPTHGTTTDILIRAADTALYRAKQNGRSRVEVA